MKIICNTDSENIITCDSSGLIPEYLELISTPDGDFYFSNTITTTDFLLVFFFILSIIFIIIKSAFKLIFSRVTYIKSKNYD